MLIVKCMSPVYFWGLIHIFVSLESLVSLEISDHNKIPTVHWIRLWEHKVCIFTQGIAIIKPLVLHCMSSGIILGVISGTAIDTLWIWVWSAFSTWGTLIWHANIKNSGMLESHYSLSANWFVHPPKQEPASFIHHPIRSFQTLQTLWKSRCCPSCLVRSRNKNTLFFPPKKNTQ